VSLRHAKDAGADLVEVGYSAALSPSRRDEAIVNLKVRLILRYGLIE
jgi:hypothetical protein